MIHIRITGDKKLAMYLMNLAGKLKNPKPFFAATGLVLTRELQKGMTGGMFSGRKGFPPVQKWTRIFRAGLGSPKGRMRPLIASGGLRRNIGIVSVGRDHVEVGHRGKYNRISTSMEDGRRGRMAVKPEMVRTAGDGHKYIRVRSNAGQWYTKKVTGGRVSVKPQKRRYFYLTARQRAKVVNEMSRYVKRAIR